ncbi:hypothetical protein [Pseudoprimorskyibacter insulae]|uniref:Uncharacterized protein n=1 Tax=Pseudoprimorskyibacter insulae TaxID=1695997 RepID=A0A2R8AVJ4_9RHOB|nr:hypothetical protein [Pseudoprimorskyibacter insulae]SPF80056.1 hypothetical protein PRI8871_01858 [Pseudoprimorskyibacter insulae]
MGRLTVRAKDSTEAMNIIMRELGPDALILSTETQGGMFEITATDDDNDIGPVAARHTPEIAPKPEAKAVDDATKGLTIFSRPSRINIDVDEPIEPEPVMRAEPFIKREPVFKPQPVVAPKAVAEPEPEINDNEPVFEDPFLDDDLDEDGPVAGSGLTEDTIIGPDVTPFPVEALRAEDVAPKAEPAGFARIFKLEIQPEPEAPVHEPQRPVTPMLQAQHVVLVGPAGAGKSLVALQLALLRDEIGRSDCPRFVFTGSDSRTDGALLFQKAALLSADCRFAPYGRIPTPDENGSQITIISGRGADSGQTDPAQQIPDGALVVLVLPAGLRRRAIERLAAPWRGLADQVVLSADAFDPIDPEEFEVLSDVGLRLAWVSRRHRMVGGLEAQTRPEPAGMTRARAAERKGGLA